MASKTPHQSNSPGGRPGPGGRGHAKREEFAGHGAERRPLLLLGQLPALSQAWLTDILGERLGLAQVGHPLAVAGALQDDIPNAMRDLNP
eukprot:9463108-Pyramimonas_sp.AAC.1